MGRVCGIAIQDDLKTVYEMKGEPVQIETSPENKRERVLIYEDCRIGLLDQFVRYVTVPALARQIEINSSLVNMRLDEAAGAVRRPLSCGRGRACIPLRSNGFEAYLGRNGRRLEAVDFFHVGAG